MCQMQVVIVLLEYNITLPASPTLCGLHTASIPNWRPGKAYRPDRDTPDEHQRNRTVVTLSAETNRDVAMLALNRSGSLSTRRFADL